MEVMTVLAQLPDEFDRVGERSAWLDLQLRPHAPSFLESIRVDSSGDLLMVDVAWGRILRLDSAGRFHTVLAYDGHPNGLALQDDGSVLIADHSKGLLRADSLQVGANISPVITGYGMSKFKGLNDVLIAPDGAVYFTDQGGTGLHDPSGRIYRLTQAGEISVVLDGLPSPNALTLDPVKRVLYVAVTRDNAVWRLPLLPDGSVAKVGRYIQLSGGVGPDGLALTASGGLLVTHLGLGTVWLFDNRGRQVSAYESPCGEDVTSVALVSDGTAAVITEATSGSVLLARLPTEAAVRQPN